MGIHRFGGGMEEMLPFPHTTQLWNKCQTGAEILQVAFKAVAFDVGAQKAGLQSC